MIVTTSYAKILKKENNDDLVSVLKEIRIITVLQVVVEVASPAPIFVVFKDIGEVQVAKTVEVSSMQDINFTVVSSTEKMDVVVATISEATLNVAELPSAITAILVVL